MSVIAPQASEPTKRSKPDVLPHEITVARLKAGPTLCVNKTSILACAVERFKAREQRPSLQRAHCVAIVHGRVTTAWSRSGSQVLTDETTLC